MHDTTHLKRKENPLVSRVSVDSFTEQASKAFDYTFEGTSEFYPYELPTDLLREDYSIGLIVGASGSGKSLLLKEFGQISFSPEWDNAKAIVSHFESPEEAVEKLSSVGLNSIPSWCKPFSALSNGEQFRANLARQIQDGALIDEFTSVVDRNVAKATATSVSKYIKRNNLRNVVFASCHYDIIEWLQPDWILDTNTGTLARDRLQRPNIELSIFETDYKSWEIFKNHHYLSANINKSARCFLAIWNEQIVGFQATIGFPSGTVKNGVRAHRTVILPDFQGLGIGARLSDAIAEKFFQEGKRFFSRTAHFRLGEYREKSPLWKPTSKNRVLRRDVANNIANESKELFNMWAADGTRVCYSHEYVGKAIDNLNK